MTTVAPGKVMLAGEYAVLVGFPAIVMAVDRHARAMAKPGNTAELPRECVSALAHGRAQGVLQEPHAIDLDVAALATDGRKLGLGSSAAATVAVVAEAVHREGGSVDGLRGTIATIAREGHRIAQQGGSGVDVLASAWGGVLRVAFPNGLDRSPDVRRLAWPTALHWAVLWTGVPARTSDMIPRVVGALRDDPSHGSRIGAATRELADALSANDAARAVRAVYDHYVATDRLGTASGVPIVTEPMQQLASYAEPLGVAIKPSGAGGGDIVFAVAHDANAMSTLLQRSDALGFARLDVSIDEHGVRVIPDTAR